MIVSYDPKIEKELYRKLISAEKKYISKLEYLLSTGQTMTPKTLKHKIAKAEKMLKNVTADFKKEYVGNMEAFFERTIENVFKNELKIVAVNWNSISRKEFERLKVGGLAFMHNYEENIIKKVQTELYLSFLNGESYTDAFKRIKPFGNDRSRPKVMVRDQMERVYQTSIVEAYGATGHPQDFLYYWTGPDDERTTDICTDRKSRNPYTWEQVCSMDSHPHIQCRHRWVAEMAKTLEKSI